MPLICLRVDESGVWPVMLNERDDLSCADGTEWRFVASVATAAEGQHLLRQLAEEAEQRAAKGLRGDPRAAARLRRALPNLRA